MEMHPDAESETGRPTDGHRGRFLGVKEGLLRSAILAILLYLGVAALWTHDMQRRNVMTLPQGNPDALSGAQFLTLAGIFATAYLAYGAEEGKQAQTFPDAFPYLLLWPETAAGIPWPIVKDSEVTTFPRFTHRPTDKTYDWTYEGRAYDLVMRNPNSSVVAPWRLGKLPSGVALPPVWQSVAQELCTPITYYCMVYKKLPATPDDAFQALHFALLDSTLRELKTHYPQMAFLKGPNPTLFALFLVAPDGTRTLVNMRTTSGSASITGVLTDPPDQTAIDQQLSTFTLWQKVEDLTCHRIADPVVPQ
ncbi:MAG: hypothetical protein ABI743_04480 [bacterium]